MLATAAMLNRRHPDIWEASFLEKLERWLQNVDGDPFIAIAHVMAFKPQRVAAGVGGTRNSSSRTNLFVSGDARGAHTAAPWFDFRRGFCKKPGCEDRRAASNNQEKPELLAEDSRAFFRPLQVERDTK
jgi:hypothetical protein